MRGCAALRECTCWLKAYLPPSMVCEFATMSVYSTFPKRHIQFGPTPALDPPRALSWVSDTFAPCWKNEHPEGNQFMMFQEHLQVLKSAAHVWELHGVGGQCAFGPRNQTEAWQPIDVGHLGVVLESLAKEHFEPHGLCPHPTPLNSGPCGPSYQIAADHRRPHPHQIRRLLPK